ncbi:MAG: hypothetical protein ACOC3V_01660 [bacterium]
MKFYYFATILIGMMIVLSAGGFYLPVTGGIIDSLGIMEKGDSGTNVTTENIKNSDLWDDDGGGSSFSYILGGLALAGVVVGFFGRTPQINYLTASLVLFITGSIMADYIAILVQLKSYGIGWLTWGGGLIFSIFMVGLFISAIEWWQGVD